MDDLEKRVKRSALKLLAAGMAIGFLLGLVVGSTLNYYTIERTVIMPLSQGIRT